MTSLNWGNRNGFWIDDVQNQVTLLSLQVNTLVPQAHMHRSHCESIPIQRDFAKCPVKNAGPEVASQNRAGGHRPSISL